jgi:hypothetical protein
LELAICQSSSGTALVLAAGCGFLQLGWQACGQSLELCRQSVELAIGQSSSGTALVLETDSCVFQMGQQGSDQSLELCR